MKSVLFKEKLPSALDFAKFHHEPCNFEPVTIGLLSHVDCRFCIHWIDEDEDPTWHYCELLP